jgi:rhodanese-related sulfurtransferase
MDGQVLLISPRELYARLGTASAPVLVDVRREDAFAADDRVIIGALRRPPNQVRQWLKALPPGRAVFVYCSHGHDASQGVASVLRDAGIHAAYVEGGISAWKGDRLPTRRKGVEVSKDKWVTREHPKIDRIACPWLVSRFINPLAEFLYVSPDEVVKVAHQVGGTPYDIKNVEFGHAGDRCSFDAIIRVYDIHDPALDHLATIVRGADTSRPDLTPQCEGLLAISRGLSANFPDDHEMLRHGLIVYDALYSWCRTQTSQTTGPGTSASAQQIAERTTERRVS